MVGDLYKPHTPIYNFCFAKILYTSNLRKANINHEIWI